MIPQAVINVFSRNPLKFSRRSSSLLEPPKDVSVLQRSTRVENQGAEIDRHVRKESSSRARETDGSPTNADNDVLRETFSKSSEGSTAEPAVTEKAISTAEHEVADEAPKDDGSTSVREYEQIVSSVEQSETPCPTITPAFSSVTVSVPSFRHIETMSVPTPEEIPAASMLDVKKDASMLDVPSSDAVAEKEDPPTSLSFASFGSSYDSAPGNNSVAAVNSSTPSRSAVVISEVGSPALILSDVFFSALSSPVPVQSNAFVSGESAGTGESSEILAEPISDALDVLSIIPEVPSRAELDASDGSPDSVDAYLGENACSFAQPTLSPSSNSLAPALDAELGAVLDEGAIIDSANDNPVQSAPRSSPSVLEPDSGTPVKGNVATEAADYKCRSVQPSVSSHSLGPLVDSSSGALRIGEAAIEPLGIPLPKTYADATNLAIKYPELSQQILKLPLASVTAVDDVRTSPTRPVSHTTVEPAARPTNTPTSGIPSSSSAGPSHTSETPNWARTAERSRTTGTSVTPNWALASADYKISPISRSSSGRGRERSRGYSRGNRRDGRSTPNKIAERVHDMPAMISATMNWTGAATDAGALTSGSRKSAPAASAGGMPSLAEYLDRSLVMSTPGSAPVASGDANREPDGIFEPNPFATEFVPGRMDNLSSTGMRSQSLSPASSLPPSRPPSRSGVSQQQQRIILHHLGKVSSGNFHQDMRVPKPEVRGQEMEKTSTKTGPKAGDVPAAVAAAQPGPVSAGWRMGEDGILRRDWEWGWIPMPGQDTVSASSAAEHNRFPAATVTLPAAPVASRPVIGTQWMPAPDEHAWMLPNGRQTTRQVSPPSSPTSTEAAARGRRSSEGGGRSAQQGVAKQHIYPRSSFGNKDFVLPPPAGSEALAVALTRLEEAHDARRGAGVPSFVEPTGRSEAGPGVDARPGSLAWVPNKDA
ncbi:hypothetical protein BKA93DRAFT_824624 [Sparassis latifolia]